MIVSSYVNRHTKSLNFRVTLNNDDKNYLSSPVVKIYQLKCIGATNEIFEKKDCLNSENFSFNDRLFPQIYSKNGKIYKAEFGAIFTMNKKKKYYLRVKIEFFKDGKFKIKDSYLYDSCTSFFNLNIDESNKDVLPTDSYRYKFFSDLENILKELFKLSEKSELCSSCKYFDSYKKNGYCLQYHPDSKIPQP